MPELRVVLDTNLLVSRLLLPRSQVAQAIDIISASGRLLMSDATLEELADVLSRRKFDRYVSVADRQEFIGRLAFLVQMTPILRQFQACRDPKDDKFLDVAVNGGATVLLTGDGDLLKLDPFAGVRIRPLAGWLKERDLMAVR